MITHDNNIMNEKMCLEDWCLSHHWWDIKCGWVKTIAMSGMTRMPSSESEQEQENSDPCVVKKGQNDPAEAGIQSTREKEDDSKQ